MHTVEQLEKAIEIAQQLGYQIRHEWLGGVGGGRCEFAGRKWIFIDLAMNSIEQLELVVDALREDPAIDLVALDDDLRIGWGLKRAA